MPADLTAADAAQLLAAVEPANDRLHDDGPRLRLAAAAPALARAVIRLEAEVAAALRRGRMEGAEAGIEAGAAWSLDGTDIQGTRRDTPNPTAIVAALEAEDAR